MDKAIYEKVLREAFLDDFCCVIVWKCQKNDRIYEFILYRVHKCNANFVYIFRFYIYVCDVRLTKMNKSV